MRKKLKFTFVQGGGLAAMIIIVSVAGKLWCLGCMRKMPEFPNACNKRETVIFACDETLHADDACVMRSMAECIGVEKDNISGEMSVENFVGGSNGCWCRAIYMVANSGQGLFDVIGNSILLCCVSIT